MCCPVRNTRICFIQLSIGQRRNSDYRIHIDMNSYRVNDSLLTLSSSLSSEMIRSESGSGTTSLQQEENPCTLDISGKLILRRAVKNNSSPSTKLNIQSGQKVTEMLAKCTLKCYRFLCHLLNSYKLFQMTSSTFSAPFTTL